MDIGEQGRVARVRTLSSADPAGRSQLLEAISDPSWRVRAAAVDGLAAGPAGEVIAPLTERAASAREPAADAAAHALVLLGEPAVPAVERLLEATDERVRKLALDVIGRIGAPSSAAAVARLLDDGDPNVRAAAAEALGGIGGPVARAGLLRALDTNERLLLACTLEALERIGEPVPLAPLLACAADPLLRRRALPLLALRREDEALVAVASALRDPAAGNRAAALAALAGIWSGGDAEARARIAEQVRRTAPAVERSFLEAPDPAVAVGAALALAWTGVAEAAPLIAMTAEDERVRPAAEEALRVLGPAAAGPLRAALEKLGAAGRAVSLRALGRVGDPRDLPLAREAASGADPLEVRLAAIAALGALGRTEAAPALLNLLGEDPQVARAAADALVRLAAVARPDVLARVRERAGEPAPEVLRLLGRIGDAFDRPRVRAALASPDPGLRAAAAESLALLFDPDAGPTLALALADESERVRIAAARALSAAGTSSMEAVSALTTALRDPDALVAAAAAEALGDMRAAGPALREALGPALARGGAASQLAVACVRGLGALGDDAGLLPAFASPDPEVLKAAMAAAGPGCEAALCEALGHPGWDVRRAAAQAILRNRLMGSLRELEAARAVEQDGLAAEALDLALRDLGG